MIIEPSKYRDYINRILEQSVSPFNIEEIVEKVANQLDISKTTLRDRIKGFLYRDSAYIILRYDGERYVVLKSLFEQCQTNEEIIEKVLCLRLKPLDIESYHYVLSQFDDSRDSYTNSYCGYNSNINLVFFQGLPDFTAIYVKSIQKEILLKNKKTIINEYSYCIGLEEWPELDGFLKIPSASAPLTTLRRYKETSNSIIQEFYSIIMSPYHHAVEDIPFKTQNYTEQLNSLIEQVYDVCQLDDKNSSFYNHYKDYMAYIKIKGDHPNFLTNKELSRWRE